MKITLAFQKFSLVLFLSLLLGSCNSTTPENSQGYPQTQDTTSTPPTDFVAHLKHTLPE